MDMPVIHKSPLIAGSMSYMFRVALWLECFYLAGIAVQDAEASGVGTDVDQILRFININVFYVIGGKPVFPGVMCKLAGLGV